MCVYMCVKTSSELATLSIFDFGGNGINYPGKDGKDASLLLTQL